MSSEHRAILLKNDDPSINYVGEWTTVQASTIENLGNFGPALSSTLHSTKKTSSFVFSFHGSSMNVFGTINVANSSTEPDPAWQCSLDGIATASNLFQFPENNWALCSIDNIPDGSHELVVNVTSNGMPFYLDYLEYRASANISLENSLIVIDNNDPAIDYVSGWDALGSTANQTTEPDGLVKVTFVGTQLSWYGFTPTEESHNAASGEYIIDGEPFVTFQLPGLSSSTANSEFNRLYFITPVLEMGTHVLSVKYTGTSDQTPLTLDYLIVTNGSFPSSSSPTSSGSGVTNGTGTRTHASNPTSSNGLSGNIQTNTSHVGAVVGGVVGSFIAVIIIIIFFFWFKSRRRRKQGHGGDFTNSIIPSYTQIHRPPILPPLSPPSSLSPLETSDDISRNRIRYASQLTGTEMTSAESYSSYSTTTNATSFYATNRASAQPTIASVASSIIRTAIRRPLPAAPAFVVSKGPMGPIIAPDIVQHKDSGIRLPTSSPMPAQVAWREREFIPRNYVIMNNSDSFT